MKLTRRAALGGALGALFGTAARAEPFRLVAGEIFPSSYDGYLPGVPGPPLRVVAGEPFRVLLVNKLPAATTLVLPGGAFPGLGAPSVAPGASAEFEMAPRAPGFWLYGDYDDMVGPLIVDESKPPPVDHDVLMAFGSDTGRRFETAAPPAGRVRLRLANARADSTVFLRAHGAKVQIVAIDGQPCEMFEPSGGEFPLCPSSRFELMFDMGETVVEFWEGDRLAGRIWPKGERPPAKPPIAALPPNPGLPDEIALERALRVDVVAAGSPEKGYSLNGAKVAAWPEKPLFSVKRGQPVTLTLVNRTDAPQTLRIEGHSARQLHALDDGWDPYWRDAMLIAPGKTLHAAFVADAPGKWPLASASPAARAKGLKGWFQVL